MKKHTVIIIVAIIYGFFRVIYPPHQGIGQESVPKKHDTVTQLVIQGLKAGDSANKTYDKLLYQKEDVKPKVETVYVPKKVEVTIHDTTIIHDTVPMPVIYTKYVATVSKKEAQRLNRWYTDSLAKLNKKIDSLTPKKKKHHKFLGL